jgi:hypothetical protein
VSDPVAAVTEAEATGEIAALFADIRAVYRVGVVNLIWRHLATIEGALPWAWHSLRPLYVAGDVEREAAALRAGLSLPDVPPIPSPVFAALGLDAAAVSGIRAVLAAYDRTNAMALVALTALQASLSDNAASATTPAAPPAAALPANAASNAATEDIPLPRLLSLDDMAPATADLVARLNRFGANRPSPILASMYRHLAHWPPYLALSWSTLAPLDADGRLGRAIEAATALAGARAAQMVLPPAVPLASGIRIQVAAALEPFTGEVIAKMVVICALMRRLASGA